MIEFENSAKLFCDFAQECYTTVDNRNWQLYEKKILTELEEQVSSNITDIFCHCMQKYFFLCVLCDNELWIEKNPTYRRECNVNFTHWNFELFVDNLTMVYWFLLQWYFENLKKIYVFSVPYDLFWPDLVMGTRTRKPETRGKNPTFLLPEPDPNLKTNTRTMMILMQWMEKMKKKCDLIF